MTPATRWLDTLWPLIRTRLPAAPARVVEVGCGSLGGRGGSVITSWRDDDDGNAGDQSDRGEHPERPPAARMSFPPVQNRK